MTDVSIIIPTYEEQGNMAILLPRIFDVLKENKILGEVIIVDDSSQDGTAAQAKKYPVKLIVRKGKRGLASACVDGFREARGKIIVVMDADLQHPPEKIPDLVHAVHGDADIAIASRYMPKESRNKLGLGRRMLSQTAFLLAKVLFKKVRKVRDIASGFFAFKRSVIEGVDLSPEGFKILLEILVLGDYKSFKEIGYHFEKRISGKSKLTFNILLDYAAQLFRLKKRRMTKMS